MCANRSQGTYKPACQNEKKGGQVEEDRQQQKGRKKKIADANAEEQLTAGDRQRTETPQEVQVK